MELTIGWWGIPALITIVAFVWAKNEVQDDSFGLDGLICYGAALIASLFVWLIYAIIF